MGRKPAGSASVRDQAIYVLQIPLKLRTLQWHSYLWSRLMENGICSSLPGHTGAAFEVAESLLESGGLPVQISSSVSMPFFACEYAVQRFWLHSPPCFRHLEHIRWRHCPFLAGTVRPHPNPGRRKLVAPHTTSCSPSSTIFLQTPFP